MTQYVKTLRFKIKPDSYNWLNAAAIEVNQVWNACNEMFKASATMFTDDYGNRCYGKRLSGFDLCNRTAGTTQYMDYIGADSVQKICNKYWLNIKSAFPKNKLSWRISSGSRRSLGWIPFKSASIKRKTKSFRFAGKAFRVFEFDKTDGAKYKDGCFAQDACGDWWLCLPIEVEQAQDIAPNESIGIDLGLKDIATTSNGERLEAGRWTQTYASKLANAQRRSHKKQVKRIHRKIARCRKDALHKFSRKIVNRYQNIIIGDVSSSKLMKTKMAKSVSDSGWSMLRNQLEYKSQQAARGFKIVDEKFTTRTCSSCGALTGPKGQDMLAVRQFKCSECGTEHDRDVNAARNILTVGLKYQASVCGNEPIAA